MTSHISLLITTKKKSYSIETIFIILPEKYALRELTHLLSFTGVHIVDKITDTNDQPKTTHFNQLQQPPDISQNVKSVQNLQNQQLKNKESIVNYKIIQIHEMEEKLQKR